MMAMMSKASLVVIIVCIMKRWREGGGEGGRKEKTPRHVSLSMYACVAGRGFRRVQRRSNPPPIVHGRHRRQDSQPPANSRQKLSEDSAH